MGFLMNVILFGGVLGNSSQVSDGAGAVLLMKRRTALEKNLPILGVFRYVFLHSFSYNVWRSFFRELFLVKRHRFVNLVAHICLYGHT